jgi:renalase
LITNTIYDVAIVGAGISAILLAHNLPNSKIILLEKSKGVGGRLATRRLQNLPFNHGARDIKPEHHLLKEIVVIGLDHHLLKMDGEICHATQGINQWTKFLTQNREILKGCLVYKIVKNSEGLLELRDSFNQIRTVSKKVVLSVPAPQASEILKNSDLDPFFLGEVKYSSAIQFLAILECPISSQSALWAQWEIKQESTLPNGYFYHLECRGPYLNDYFELEKTVIQTQITDICEAENIHVKEVHLHKWRYSQVTHCISPQYQDIASEHNIYLMGDYFYGNDLNAAAQSVECTIKKIIC